MNQKKNKILFWVFTVLFSGLMIFSSLSGFGPNKDGIEVLHNGLGYPIYFIQFISWAKVLGVLAILIPGLNKTIKEWAYAGLFFDLAWAVYSGFAAGNWVFNPLILTMLIWIVPGILSYYFWKKINH